MTFRPLLSIIPALLLYAAGALADDKSTCVEAASLAQKSRAAHKLIEAREHLRVCAAEACPAVIQNDCVAWLAEVDRALPGVVISAKSPDGSDLIDVTVTVDGQPLTKRLDGQAIAVNAGAHVFQFESPARATLGREILVKEGEKSQAISVVLLPSASPSPTARVPASRPRRTLGWVFAGVGTAGLAVGGAFGALALVDKSHADCIHDVCNPGTLSGMKSAAIVSDAGWIGGGLLLATGAALVFLSPAAKADSAHALRVFPVVSLTGAQVVAGGRF
jgi:hypothetical protein